MPNVNVQFNGQTIVIPSAVYADNVSNALVPTQALTPPALFIGNFYGLAPNTPTTFVLAQDAINVFVVLHPPFILILRQSRLRP